MLKRNIPLLLWFFILRGSNMYATYLPPLLQSLQFNDFRFLLLMAVTHGVAAIFETPTGYWADRYGRRLSMVAGMACAMVAMLLYATLSGFGLQAFAAAALLGIGTSLMIGADSAMLYDTLQVLGREAEARFTDAKFRGYYALSEAACTIAIIFLGSFSGYRGVLLIQAAIFGLAMIVAWAMVETPRHPQLQSLPKLVKRSLKTPKLTASLLLAAATGNLSGVLVWWTALYYLATSGLQIGQGEWGWVYNAIWAGFLLSVFGWRKLMHWFAERPFGPKGIPLLIGIAAVGYFGLAFLPWYLGMACIALTYLVRANVIPICNQHINELVANEERATMHSISRTMSWLIGSGIWLISSSISQLSNSTVLGIVSAGILVVGLATTSFLWVKRLEIEQPNAAVAVR